MTVDFELDGIQFTALNGGPDFKFNEAVSLQVNCDTQEEIDHFWNKLTEEGQEIACGWLKDKYGLSWQVSATILSDMISDPDQAKADRVMKAFLQMKKFDIAKLKDAYEGK
jgi:predicted 3-demethylubiquinone-9 3-methyltransferase (glyoxalase superfamily)